MGNSLADQRVALKSQLSQWEEAPHHGNPDVPNEVHVAGDMNLDSLKGRWLEPGYPLVFLARMVVDCCNANNFKQMVDNITRSQYNSVKHQASISCIDHLYCNARYRISPVKVLTCGASDHDAISYIRYSKEPRAPTKTVRKRSYKDFDQEAYLAEVSNIDFSDVYFCLDVEDAATVLTQKLVHVLDKYAPWIVYQQHKHYAPWITSGTLQLMKERDMVKEKAKELAKAEGQLTSPEQAELWRKYKSLRNSVNNKLGREEFRYKREKFNSCQDNPGMTWNLAKSRMNWSSPGPPRQLEVKIGSTLRLLTRAKDIAQAMNEYFISKVESIV